jgi:hypothetical protein
MQESQEHNQHHQRLDLQLALTRVQPPNSALAQRGDTQHSYEIAFIFEGQANGWTFPRSALQESTALWENCSVMIDHSLGSRSLRDLGGALHKIQWSEQQNGLTGVLVPVGPSREIVIEVATLMLGLGPRPDVGFSADLIFTADANKQVKRIIKPLSVDLVMDPAFASRFIRQLNSKGVHMATEPNQIPASLPESPQAPSTP